MTNLGTSEPPEPWNHVALIYGIHAVAEALNARRVSRLVHVRGGGPRIDALVARAVELRIPVETVDRRALDKLTRGGVHQGVAGEMQAVAAYTLEELVAGADGPALLVVLDGIEDPQNVGAILRCADGGGRARRHPAGAPRGAARRRDGQGLGRRGPSRADCDGRQHLPRARGVEGTRTSGRSASTPPRPSATTQVDYTLPTAFVLGAEGTGLRRLVRETCDRLVGIPMAGQVSSLNVSVSAGIALFEAARQRRPRRP